MSTINFLLISVLFLFSGQLEAEDCYPTYPTENADCVAIDPDELEGAVQGPVDHPAECIEKNYHISTPHTHSGTCDEFHQPTYCGFNELGECVVMKKYANPIKCSGERQKTCKCFCYYNGRPQEKGGDDMPNSESMTQEACLELTQRFEGRKCNFNSDEHVNEQGIIQCAWGHKDILKILAENEVQVEAKPSRKPKK